MKPNYPKTEWLLHNRIDLLSPEQVGRYYAMVRLSDVLNLAMRRDVDRITGKYNEMWFTEFLEKLYSVSVMPGYCETPVLVDDFVQIARYSFVALKHIVNSPSTQIVKTPEKVRTDHLRQSTAQTMRWLAKRPGRSVAEKIAPEYKVLTNKAHFSADTKENREALYLYDILHDVMTERTKGLHCTTCRYSDRCMLPHREFEQLIALRTRVKRGELHEVPAQKQSMQNNKLMCDKYYKIIWDATARITKLEEKLKQDWDVVEQRYYRFGFWIIAATLLTNCRFLVYDFRGILLDENGKLSFQAVNASGEAFNNRDSLIFFNEEEPTESWTLKRFGSVISLGRTNSKAALLRYDLLSDLTEDMSLPHTETAEVQLE